MNGRLIRSCIGTLVLLVASALLGCTRGLQKNGNASIVLRVPGASPSGSSVGAFASLPQNRKACFGLNITASDINTQPQTCGPSTGIVAGFVESGATIEVGVPKGTGRKFDLYLYLQPEGTNIPCPSMAAIWSIANVMSTYLIGSLDNIALEDDEVTLNIDATFSGTSSHIAQQMGLPETCLPQVTPPPTPPAPISTPKFRILTTQGIATGSGMKLYGKIGRTSALPSASGGTGYIIKPNLTP